LTITTTSLADGIAGTAYSASLAASGGTGSISWRVTTGNLPGALTLSDSGDISGTPTAAGTTNFTVTATDSSTPPQTAKQALTITINPKLVITTATLPSGVVSAAYTATLQSSGGVGTITWSVSSGSLPAGLAMSNSGVISGTPTTAGTSSFTVQAKDSGAPQQSVQQALSIAVYTGLTISTTSLPNGTVNSAYSATLKSVGGTGTVTWSISQGSLPTGLNLGASGTISGSPSTAGTSNFTVSATDSSTPPQTKTQALSMVINPALSITTTSLPAGTVATAYSQNIQTSGGTLPIAWSVTAGTLPAGLTLAGNSGGVGVISGTPTAYGSSSFTVTATDSSSPPQSVNQQFTIVINNVGLSITTTTLPNATVGTAYNAPLDASGGTPPYTWTVATGSTLPAGLTLGGSGTTWTLSGTPTAAATSNFSLTVTDSSSPAQSKTVALSVTITAPSTACGTGNEQVLKGQYAFRLVGFNSSGFQATVGSFTADGAGHITAGLVDSNGVSPGVNSGSITAGSSSYSVGSDNRGCATIATPFYTYTTRFALAPTSGVAAAGSVEEWESGSSPYIASGQILLQSVPSTLPSGTYVLQESGIYDVTHQYWAGGVGAGSGSVGQFTNGEYDLNVEGHHFSYTGVTGGYSNLDPTTGRVTSTITLNGVTSHGVHYLVSSTYLISVTADALATDTFVAAGTGQVQASSFTLTNGQNLVFYATGQENVEFAVVAITGSGSMSANIYHDVQGNWTSPSPSTASCDYTIDTYGRVATSGPDCGVYFDGTSWHYPPVFYLTGNNTGVMLSTNDPGVLLGQLEPQSATSITAGTYDIGTQEVVNQNVNETLTGQATITSSGSLTGTGDSTAIGTAQKAGQPLSATLTVNADGTFSTSNNPGIVIGVIISGSQLIQVDGSSGLFPTILVLNAGIDD
jgi:large repetitive protein